MKLEDQVSSLEPSKRLKELGVKQESYFAWLPVTAFGTEPVRYQLGESTGGSFCFSAFTVAELGEMLPHWNGKLCYSNQLVNRWVCVYAAEHREQFLEVQHTEVGETEADARAKMLIYLIEQGLVKP